MLQTQWHTVTYDRHPCLIPSQEMSEHLLRLCLRTCGSLIANISRLCAKWELRGLWCVCANVTRYVSLVIFCTNINTPLFQIKGLSCYYFSSNNSRLWDLYCCAAVIVWFIKIIIMLNISKDAHMENMLPGKIPKHIWLQQTLNFMFGSDLKLAQTCSRQHLAFKIR